MKIMHTSDWHLGKKLQGRLRLNEQAEVMQEICSIAESQGVDLVLIAGDIFDTFVPPADAEELFFDTLNRLASGDRAVVIISGNHDDSVRLSASRTLASRSNVYIFGGENAPLVGNNCIFAEQTGKNYCIIRKGEERIYIGALPYPTEQRYGEKKNELTFEQKMQGWIDACFEQNIDNLPQIFVGHLFMLGGNSSNSERQIELGGTRLVNKNMIPSACIYSALGHLHKRQVIDGECNILYSGSILQYDFDEVNIDKSVTIFDVLEGRAENLVVHKLNGGKRLLKLTAFNFEGAKELLSQNADFHIFLTLKLKEVLTEAESRELVSAFPQLVDYRIELPEASGEQSRTDRRTLSDEQVFIEYYKHKFGEEPDQKLLNLYLEFMEELK